MRPGDDITIIFHTSAPGHNAVGNYDIVPEFKDLGGRLSNYTVHTNRGSLTITPAPLTVTADNQTRVYGANNPVFTGGLTG